MIGDKVIAREGQLEMEGNWHLSVMIEKGSTWLLLTHR